MCEDTPTDEEFRAAGFLGNARSFPLSAAACRFIAHWNGVAVEQMPRAWRYAPNAAMLEQVERMAREAEGGDCGVR